jgi:hypothetical protein
MAVCSLYPQDFAAAGHNVMSGQETLTSLDSKGLRFHEDSFEVTFENWGKVRFITGIDIKNRRVLCIYLTDDQENVLYKFPLANKIRWLMCDEVKAVSFADLDKDGLADVVVIGIYNTGVGSGPLFSHFHVATIYFQKGTEFINDPNLDKQINDAYKNRTIDMVLDFVANKLQ